MESRTQSTKNRGTKRGQMEDRRETTQTFLLCVRPVYQEKIKEKGQKEQVERTEGEDRENIKDRGDRAERAAYRVHIKLEDSEERESRQKQGKEEIGPR